MKLSEKLEIAENKAREALDEVAEIRAEMGSHYGIKAAMSTIRSEMKENSAFTWGWHCSLVMALIDGNNDEANRIAMNDVAARMMKAMFDVDVTKNKNWQRCTAKPAQKEFREYAVVPRYLSEKVAGDVWKKIEKELSISDIKDIHSLILEATSVPVTPYQSSLVPYAESTQRTRKGWIEFLNNISTLKQVLPAMRGQASKIAIEIERSMSYGRPFNAGIDVYYTKPKEQSLTKEEIESTIKNWFQKVSN